MTLGTPSEFHAGNVATHLMGDLAPAVTEANPDLVAIEVVA